MCFTCPFVCSTRAVPGQHLPAAPAGKSHEVLLLAPLRQPPVRKGVTEHVRVQVVDTCLLRSSAEHLGDPVASQDTSSTQPQRRPSSQGVLVALTQVPLDRLTRLVTEGTGPRAMTLAQDKGDVSIKINVCKLQSGNLGEPHAGVQEEPDDGGVPVIFEPSAGRGPQQSIDGCIIKDRNGCLRNRWGPEACHRRDLDELLRHSPAVELLEVAVATRCGGRPVSAQLITKEVLDVATGQRVKITTSGVLSEQLCRLKVGLDGPRAAVACPQAPCEGPQEQFVARSGRRHSDQVRCCRSAVLAVQVDCRG